MYVDVTHTVVGVELVMRVWVMKKMEMQEKKSGNSKWNMMSKNKPAAFYNLKFYIVKTRVLLLLGSFEEKKAVLLPG